MKLASLLLLAIVAGRIAVAAAEPVALPGSKALFDVPKTWTPLPRPTEPVVAAWQRGASVLAVSRAAVPNTSAWIKGSRDGYAQEVERGAVTAVAGTRLLARALADLNGVPTLDLELRRPDGTQLVIRILLFRTYALAATLEVPKGEPLGEARAIVRSLTAPKPRA